MSSDANDETRADACAFYAYLLVGLVKYTTAYIKVATVFIAEMPVDLGVVHELAFIVYALMNIRRGIEAWLRRRKK